MTLEGARLLELHSLFCSVSVASGIKHCEQNKITMSYSIKSLKKQNQAQVWRLASTNRCQTTLFEVVVVVVVVVVKFIKHQNRAITCERVAARAAPSYQYAMVLVIHW